MARDGPFANRKPEAIVNPMATGRSTGTRKAAILLLSLGEDAAAEVLKLLDDEEVRAITTQMTRFEDVTLNDVDRVANEYFVRHDEGAGSIEAPETKLQYLRRVLSKALGETRGGDIVEGILNRPPGGALEKLKWHAPRTIAGFIANEHPQVIAVILATMDEDGLAERVLTELPSEMQSDVVERLAGLNSVSQEWIDEIEQTLADTMLPAAKEVIAKDAAEQRVAEVLVTGPRAMERAIMDHIERKDPEVAERIRDQMLRFEDFIRIDNPGLQRILHRSSMQDLVLALRLADDELRGHVMSNLSTHTAQTVAQDLEELNPTHVSVIEAAQQRLVAIARQLLDKGEVTLLGKPGTMIA